ncbi:MAG: hypothetical protein MZV65_38405 [Chromatiales bacterium]|nr:hypothetical protein [Chromatiales bacterium]
MPTPGRPAPCPPAPVLPLRAGRGVPRLLRLGAAPAAQNRHPPGFDGGGPRPEAAVQRALGRYCQPAAVPAERCKPARPGSTCRANRPGWWRRTRSKPPTRRSRAGQRHPRRRSPRLSPTPPLCRRNTSCPVVSNSP